MTLIYVFYLMWKAKVTDLFLSSGAWTSDNVLGERMKHLALAGVA